MFRQPSRRSARRRRRPLPVTIALALLTPLVPAAALVAASPGVALAASPAQQEVYVIAAGGTLYALSAAAPATQEFQVTRRRTLRPQSWW